MKLRSRRSGLWADASSLGQPRRAVLRLRRQEHVPEIANSIIEANPNEILGQVRAKASERAKAAAQATTGEVLPRGGDQKSAEDARRPKRKLRIDTQPERAKSAGTSRRTQQKLDALARYAPDQFRQVRAGRKSTDAAYREADPVEFAHHGRGGGFCQLGGRGIVSR